MLLVSRIDNFTKLFECTILCVHATLKIYSGEIKANQSNWIRAIYGLEYIIAAFVVVLKIE